MNILDKLCQKFSLTPELKNKLAPFIDKMSSDPPLVIERFAALFKRLESGERLKLLAPDIKPLAINDSRVVDYSYISKYADLGTDILGSVVILKLNGGLGTSMGCEEAKSIIVVDKEAKRTFLDMLSDQVASLSNTAKVPMKLWLMNSFNTQKDTARILDKHSYGEFLQNRFPKITNADPENRVPCSFPDSPEKEWNPPGHGDIYTAMQISGWLDEQLAAGKEYVFISNSDNLGATLEPAILGLMKSQNIDFLMETTPKTPADIKGGSLIVNDQGNLQLLEIAQVDVGDNEALSKFQSLPIFNTNNIWINLKALKKALEETSFELPLIQNDKQVEGIPVIQLETAMGAAIQCFDKAKTLVVPRERFVPVKTTNDLLLLHSDIYLKNKNGTLSLNPDRKVFFNNNPSIKLDPAYYKNLKDYQERIPKPPSLVALESLSIKGDIHFSDNVCLKGKVSIITDRYLELGPNVILDNISINDLSNKLEIKKGKIIAC